MSGKAQTCDFCGCAFEWTDEQLLLDVHLRLLGSGLGACCDDCDDKIIAADIAAHRRRRRP